MKRTITLLLFLFAINSHIKAQLGTSSPFQEAKDYTKALEFSGGWFRSEFLNENFSQNLENGNIKHDLGGIFRTRLVAYPFLYDFEWFFSKYDLDNEQPTLSSYTSLYHHVRHRGINVAMSLVLIPTSKYITPYVGAGYQFAELGNVEPIFNLDSESDIPNNTNPFESNIKMNTPFWKVGLTITPHKSFSVSGEFRNSLGLEDGRAFNQYSITANWRIPLGSARD